MREQENRKRRRQEDSARERESRKEEEELHLQHTHKFLVCTSYQIKLHFPYKVPNPPESGPNSLILYK